jgi:hypothetical protein
MKTLTLNRFNLLAGYSRRPGSQVLSEELEWFEIGNERLLGVVLFDRTDRDFGWVILARDRMNRFRALKFEHSLPTKKSARQALKIALARTVKQRTDSFYQGDETGEPIDFFRPVVPSEKLGRAFRELSTKGSYPSAKLLQEMLHWYEDVDGNFLEQFQTVGFDARLWELYIFATFTELGYAFDRSFNAPDFFCIGPYGRFFIEATTVNPSNPPVNLADLTSEEYYRDYVPKKFGSALYSKLKKRYWEKEHVKNHPLVFAVQDFHEWQSMSWSLYALSEFLFGARNASRLNGSGVYETFTEKIQYKLGDSTMAGFFSLPDTEHISCVIANPGGTIGKFDRIGLQAGFGEGKTTIVRFGDCFKDLDVPERFTYTVNDTDYVETWVEGLTVFHNPNALHPLPLEAIPGAAHFRFINDEIRGILPPFYPIGSTSFVMHATNDLPPNDDEARRFIESKLKVKFKDELDVDTAASHAGPIPDPEVNQ